VAVSFGDKARLAVEVGDWSGPALRRVDLWAAGQWLTCDDNTVYVPQFRRAVSKTAAGLRAGHGESLPFAGLSTSAAHRRIISGEGNEEEDDALRTRFRIFSDWGPTTDNVEALLFRDGERVEITWHFWREAHLRRHPEHTGTVFAVEIRAAELAAILGDLVAALDCDTGPPGRTLPW
jgi:hypothetical protein